jgi:RNA polymerase sigma-70 factor, ECF subfamily
VAGRDHTALETLMRQSNRRLFRSERVIVKDDSAAESMLQEAYVAAYSTMKTFGDDANLSIGLTRILINEALRRVHEQRSDRVEIPFSPAGQHSLETERASPARENRRPPEDPTLRAEIRELIEKKLDELPLALRMVFVMRELEGMTVEETAECLGIPEATVRSRLSRAKSQLRTLLDREIDRELGDVFAFGGDRGERIVEAVLGRISNDGNHI